MRVYWSTEASRRLREITRELLERPYRLIFEVTTRGIEIVTVMHYRQLLPDESGDLRGN